MARLIIILIVIAAVVGGIYYTRGSLPGMNPTGPAAGPTASPSASASASAGSSLYNKAYTYGLESNYDLEISTYREALSKFPGDSHAPQAKYDIAKALEDTNKPDEALAAYKDFVDSYPDDSRVTAAKKRIDYLVGTGAH